MPHSIETTLSSLSPVLSQEQDFAAFTNAALSTPYGKLSKAQIKGLDIVFDALTKADPEQNITPKKLSDIFQNIARYQRFIQFQRPIITNAQTLEEKLKQSFSNQMDESAAKKAIVFYSDFGRIPLIYDAKNDQSLSYSFTFLAIKSPKNPRSPFANTAKQTLLAFPVLGLPQPILDSLNDDKGRKFLSTLQDCSKITNHDYIHALTGSITPLYYADAPPKPEADPQTAHNLVLASTPYMHAMQQLNIAQTPRELEMASLFQSTQTISGCRPSTLAMYAYEVLGTQEGQAFYAHKALISNHFNSSKHTRLIDSYFEQLKDITQTLFPQNTHERDVYNAFFTNILYHRMLHTFAYTHPLMQQIEAHAQTIPLKRELFIDTLKRRLTPTRRDGFTESSEKLALMDNVLNVSGLKGNLNIEKLEAHELLRANAHMRGYTYWHHLHAKPHPDVEEYAIPDLMHIIKTTDNEMQQVRNFERIQKLDKRNMRLKNTPC